MTALSAAEAYRLWAPAYEPENALTTIEDGLARAMTPPLERLRLLDVGCGTGRRLRGCGAATCVGIDSSAEMLAQAGDAGLDLRLGDMRALPLPDAAFDIVWCRLAIGHVPDCRPVYAELARVAAAGARILVTDFHPEASARGWRRTFRAGGTVHEAEHFVHSPADHRGAAAAAGLDLVETREGCVGEPVRHFYAERGRLSQFEEQQGLPVVLAMLFRKGASRCAC